MSRLTFSILSILSFILLISWIVIVKVKLIVSKICFSRPELTGLDPTKIFSLQSNCLNSNFLLKIQNENNFNISISNVYVELFHRDSLVGRSCTDKNNTSIQIKKNSISPFVHCICILVQPATLALYDDIKNKVPVELQYTIKFKIFGLFTYSISDKQNLVL